MQWAEHIHGLRGTIIFASEVKAGDKILYLDKQIDLGNDRPNDVRSVEFRGEQVVVLNVTRIITVTAVEGHRRLHRNTLLLRVEAGDLPA